MAIMLRRQQDDDTDSAADLIRRIVQEAIDEHVDWQDGEEWRSPFFDLIRKLKAIPFLRSWNGGRTWELIAGIFSVEQFMDWDTRFGCDEDVEVSFLGTWDAVRYGEGEGFLRQAFDFAKRNPAKVQPARGKSYGLFIAMVWTVANALEPNPDGTHVIAIPQESWGTELKVSRQTVATWCKWAQIDGILRIYREHSRAGERPTATQYSVNGRSGKTGKFTW